MKDIFKIHGSSSRVTFEPEDATIFGSGEFCARSGKIDGFFLQSGSLRFEDGSVLSSAQEQELKSAYLRYLQTRPPLGDFILWDI